MHMTTSACALADCLVGLYKWLLENQCKTADSLLSISFAINTIFTGLSFSRFSLFVWMEKRAIDCVKRSSDASFLEKIERLSQDSKKLRKQLSNYSCTAAKFLAAMTSGSRAWEGVGRMTSALSAIAAFVLLAFESNTRIGVCLTFPYVILLIVHFGWVFLITYRVKRCFGKLSQALNAASEEEASRFEVSDCIKRLRESQDALSKALEG